MTTVERPQYKVIGTRPIRPDGAEKVTGKAQYGADIRLPGLLHGRVLRSPHAHARIVSIDTSEAEAMEGVLAVVTAADFGPIEDKVQDMGEGAVNVKELADNVLASDKALYRGHAVAGVAATTAHVAEEAIRRIKVQYDVLQAVVDVRDAMRDDAPLLNEKRFTREMGALKEDRPSNIASHNRFQLGDVEKAFSEADVVIEREFTTKMVHQGYIEPHNGTASWNTDDTLTVWTSTQGAFGVRSQLSTLLRLPISRIRVIPMEIGGGFGGKIPVYLEPVAALLSKKTGRPVKVLMNRTDVFEATGPTSGTWIKLKLGATNDGTILAAEATLAYEAGAYPGAPVMMGAMTMLSPYDLPNLVIDAYDVVVNKPKVSAYRAPGAPAAAFACEQLLDEIAKKINMDPLDLRLKNSAREGSVISSGMKHPVIGHEECIKAAQNSPHYRSPIEGPYRGRGVASGYWFNAGLQSSVVVGVNADGTVNLIEGNTDIGGTRASLAMQLAETLGLPYEKVHPIVADTDSVGYSDLTGGSRTTFATGMVAHHAGLDVQREMVIRASRTWQCEADDLEYADGGVQSKADSSKRLEFAEIAAHAGRTGGPIVGRATMMTGGLGGAVGGAFATHIVDVEVDPETGKTEILRYTAIQDVGTAVHPSYVEGQIQGGAAQGIGWALNEEYYYDDSGRMANSSYLDYRMPTALDVPNIDTILVEVFNPGHPYGVRGVGEVPIVPPLAAVANAIADATGHRFTDLPISPRRVSEALNGLD